MGNLYIDKVAKNAKKSMRKILLAVVAISLFGCSKEPVDKKTDPKATTVETTTQPTKPESIPAKPVSNYDGPLGIKKGISPKELVDVFKFEPSKDVANIYIGNPPKEIDGASKYFVFATEKQGLCKIVATIPISPVNDTGDQLKSAADRMKDLMEIKYGSNFSRNFRFSQDVYERNPQFFMMALKEESVSYSYIWNSKKIKEGLPSDIETIVIRLIADKSSSGAVQVLYEFNNLDQCIQETKEKKASNL